MTKQELKKLLDDAWAALASRRWEVYRLRSSLAGKDRELLRQILSTVYLQICLLQDEKDISKEAGTELLRFLDL